LEHQWETLPDTRYLHATGTLADTNERVVVSHGTVSLPLAAGENRNVAVKVVDDRGIESRRARFTMANSLILNSPYDPPTLY
jgi:hypothetical protein